MELVVNGKQTQCSENATVAEVLSTLDLGREATGMAVAINGAVVPRSQWNATALARGDKVEIIHAVQGG